MKTKEERRMELQQLCYDPNYYDKSNEERLKMIRDLESGTRWQISEVLSSNKNLFPDHVDVVKRHLNALSRYMFLFENKEDAQVEFNFLTRLCDRIEAECKDASIADIEHELIRLGVVKEILMLPGLKGLLECDPETLKDIPFLEKVEYPHKIEKYLDRLNSRERELKQSLLELKGGGSEIMDDDQQQMEESQPEDQNTSAADNQPPKDQKEIMEVVVKELDKTECARLSFMELNGRLPSILSEMKKYQRIIGLCYMPNREAHELKDWFAYLVGRNSDKGKKMGRNGRRKQARKNKKQATADVDEV